MKRILVVSHSFLANDPRVRRAVYAMVDAGWTVEGLFLDPPLNDGRLRTWRVPIRRRQGGIARYAYEYGVFFLWMLGWVLIRSIRHHPDVVYVNSPPDAFALAASPARLFGARVILDIHDPMPELLLSKGRTSGAAWKALVAQERLGMASADSLITVHEPLADLITERVTDAEFSIVMNVPNLADWPELERDPASRTLIYTGTVANRYGLDDAIRAVALAAPDIPNLRLRIVGDGEDLETLRRLVVVEGVADRVEFVGRVPYAEIRTKIDGAWMGINLPKPDGLGELSFSNKVVEWVGIGLPVLAARTSTMERYFPEDTLFYTDGGNVEAIADSLRAVHRLSSEDVSGRIDASQRALEPISWDVQRASLLATIEETAERSSS